MLHAIHKNFYLNAITFCQLVEIGSFTGVAKKMEISQPTVTRRIAALEESLNLILIKRNTKLLSITEVGRRFYDLFASQEKNLVEALHSFSDESLNNEITINLSIPTGVANHIISPRITLFTQKYPNVNLNIFYQNREIDLIKEQIDIAVIRQMPKQQTIKVKKIYNAKIHLYSTPKYRSMYGDPKSLEDLVANHHVANGIQDDKTLFKTLVYDENGRIIEFQYKTQIHVNTIESALLLARNGHLLVPGSDLMYKEQILRGELFKVLPQYSFSGTELYIARIDGAHHPLINELVQFIEQCFI